MRSLRKTSIITPNKLRIFQKEAVARLQSRFTPTFLVNEYPKSGGTWLKFMLSEALECPPWTQGKPAWSPCVMQAHWIQEKGKCNTVALFRDGRDVMVSYYYHAFFTNDFQNQALVRVMREKFNLNDLSDIKSNMYPFINRMLDKPVSPPFSWVDFVRKWANRPDVAICHYEDLRADTAGELIRLTKELQGKKLNKEKAQIIANRYSMDKMRQRKLELNPGIAGRQKAETSFIRKGAVNGWSDSFSDEALALFEEKAGQELKMLGYKVGRPESHNVKRNV